MPVIHRDVGVLFWPVELDTASERGLQPTGWSRPLEGLPAVRCRVGRTGGASHLVLRIDTSRLSGPGPDGGTGGREALLEVTPDRVAGALGVTQAVRMSPVTFRVLGADAPVAEVELVVDLGNTNTVATALVRGSGDQAGRIESVPILFCDRFQPVALRSGSLAIRRASDVPSCFLVEEVTPGAPPSRDNPVISVGTTARERHIGLGAGRGQYWMSPKRMLFDDSPATFRDASGTALDPPARLAQGGWKRCHAAALFLREVLLGAQEFLNVPAGQVLPRRVLRGLHFTVPVTFSRVEVEALCRAGELAVEMAGLNVPSRVRCDVVCDEASAVARFFLHDAIAALARAGAAGQAAAFGELVRRHGRDGRSLRIMVLDVGGGTSDLSVERFEVVGAAIRGTREYTDGMVFGGDSFTQSVVGGLATKTCSARGTCDGNGSDPLPLDLNAAGMRDLAVARGLLEALDGGASRLRPGTADELGRIRERFRLDDAFLDSAGSGSIEFDPHRDRLDAPPRVVAGRFYRDGVLTDLEVRGSDIESWSEGAESSSSRPWVYPAIFQYWVRAITAQDPDLLLVSGRASRPWLVGERLERELYPALARNRIVRLATYTPTADVPEPDKSAVSAGAAVVVCSQHGQSHAVFEVLPFEPAARDFGFGAQDEPSVLRTRVLDARRSQADAEVRSIPWPRAQKALEVEMSFGGVGSPRTPAGRVDVGDLPSGSVPLRVGLQVLTRDPSEVRVVWTYCTSPDGCRECQDLADGQEARLRSCPHHRTLEAPLRKTGYSPSYLFWEGARVQCRQCRPEDRR